MPLAGLAGPAPKAHLPAPPPLPPRRAGRAPLAARGEGELLDQRRRPNGDRQLTTTGGYHDAGDLAVPTLVTCGPRSLTVGIGGVPWTPRTAVTASLRSLRPVVIGLVLTSESGS